MFSDLEYDHWILVEGDPDIVCFCEQPKQIQVQIDGSIVESILDMWIQRKEGAELFVEIKYAAELDPKHRNFSERSFKQTKAQQKWCEENGFKYEIRTDKEIRVNPVYLDNLKMILPYVRQRAKPIETDYHRILTLLKKSPSTLLQMEQYFLDIPKQRIREAICRMIYTGTIRSNIDTAPFNNNTEVWINDQTEMDRK
ncbi:Tn7 transposase TnsA N-terminal domain-containing protein [Paenibacillus alkaliterrae]